MRFLAPDAVRLLDGPMRRAQEVDLAYLLALDPDRLLAPLRREAGMTATATAYGSWESDGLGGHILGHYLAAAATFVATTGDPRVRERLEHVVAEVEACQLAGDDGYVGGVPDGRRLWAEVATGEFAVSGFDIAGRWVPWYNLHKLFAGLIEAWRIAGSERARDVVLRLADWWLRMADGLDAATFERMLTAEFGGMNEVFADLAALTERDDLLAMADRFSDHRILDPLLAGEDALTGLHANTQIPKAIGYARLGAVSGDSRMTDAARRFWDVVVGRRTVAIGGNSTREHFHPADDFSSQTEEREGPETCNTWNMVRLSRLLLESDGDARYLEYAERALHNHLLSAQHPERGGFVYFTPLRPAHYRVYSSPQEGFWCCVGSGLEAQARYGDLVFAEDDRGPIVNLFIPAAVDRTVSGLGLTLDTRFPDEDAVRLTISADAPTAAVLRFRVPSWVAGRPTWRLGGEPIEPDRVARGYAEFDRSWTGETLLEVTLPMRVSTERLGDGSAWIAFLHGPVVLAARNGREDLDGLRAGAGRMDHVAHGPLVPLAATPIVTHDDDPAGCVERASDGSFVLHADGVEVPLEPFAGIHDARYTVYWPDAAGEDAVRRRATLIAQDERVLGLDARTLDAVTAGEQQPELDHALDAEGSEAGMTDGRRHRSASGWFAYRLADPGGEAGTVRVTALRSADDRRAELEVDGVPVAVLAVDGGTIGEEIVVDVDLETLDRGSVEHVFVLIRGSAGLRTPDVVTVRILRP